MYIWIFGLFLLGFSSAENQTDSVVINTSTIASSVANQEPIETFLLNSYNYDNPLIIRSRISESLKSPQQQDIKQQAKFPQAPSNVPSQYAVPLPYFSIQQDKIESGIEVLPTVSIPTISDLSAFLYQDSPYAVGLTSFESNFPTYYPAAKLVDPVPILPVLTPAQLQFSNSWNPATTEAPVKKDSLPQSLSQKNFLIEQVPEVASYTKIGHFSISDIPELPELEAIFKNSSAVEVNVESRLGTEEDLVETTTVQSNFEIQSAVSDIESNKIENDEDDKPAEILKTDIWNLVSGQNSTEQQEENATATLDETTVVTENIVI